ncbi:DUF2207 domain-containing protein [bacterium]|nr:DUF2207 domain-containing protein [bacterium]
MKEKVLRLSYNLRKNVVKVGTILALVFCSFFVSFVSAYAEDEELAYYPYVQDYVIDSYNIDIVVNENNTFDITEQITTTFNVPKHGIFRKIPLSNEIQRLDSTKSYNRAQVSNVEVTGDKYKTSRENGYYVIKIGSSDVVLTGPKSYTISYTYNIGKDPSKDYDELYYNIIGTEWDTTISGVSFTITMPKEFDSSKLGFSSGAYGSTNNSNISYRVEGNKIIGTYNGTLGSNEALTVRCELEEGYFVGAGLNVNRWLYLLLLIPVIFLCISIYLWFKYGKGEPVVETVEFYPPEGLNSLEVGYLYKCSVNSEDVTSLLIYLANKGYLKISELEEKVLFSKVKRFKITKLKEYDGNNEEERIFMDGLFKKGDEVTHKDLYDKFYLTINKIISRVQSDKNKNKIIEKTSVNKRLWIALMIILSYGAITIPPVLLYSEPDMLFLALFPAVGWVVMVSMLLADSSVFTKIFGVIWGLGFGGVPAVMGLLPILRFDSVYLVGYIVGIVCVAIMIYCFIHLFKRTPYGNEMYGKIKGFRNFLISAEKEKLEAMVNENPTYFFDILPYTYVLGVSKKWIKKFESISLKAPNWYDNDGTFNYVMFNSFMNNTMRSATTAMSSSPSSSGGGGSSGGGFSGGGSGGGGGGSW